MTALADLGTDVLKKAGLNAQEAEVLTDCMLTADLRGIASHGISRLRTYSNRVRAGVIASGAVPTITAQGAAMMAVDAGNGVGAVAGRWVMDRCIGQARKSGACFATVRNANHFGIGAYYTGYAARQDMIGVALSNSEAAVVPAGGARPMLGTNPLSLSAPAGRHAPFVLDMATSVVARGKIVLAQKEGHSIPDNWAVDENGAPTTDPSAALKGALLPFGGAKGYGLSLFIDILCSCLAGALDCRRTYPFWDDFDHPQDVGYFMGVFDVSHFLEVETFKRRIDTMFDEFKACPPAPGVDEVMIPGEPEARAAQRGQAEGVELSPAVVDDLTALAGQYGVAPGLLPIG